MRTGWRESLMVCCSNGEADFSGEGEGAKSYSVGQACHASSGHNCSPSSWNKPSMGFAAACLMMMSGRKSKLNYAIQTATFEHETA